MIPHELEVTCKHCGETPRLCLATSDYTYCCSCYHDRDTHAPVDKDWLTGTNRADIEQHPEPKPWHDAEHEDSPYHPVHPDKRSNERPHSGQ